MFRRVASWPRLKCYLLGATFFLSRIEVTSRLCERVGEDELIVPLSRIVQNLKIANKNACYENNNIHLISMIFFLPFSAYSLSHDNSLTPSLRPRPQICPICAALPGGDPNHVTDDFTAHLTLEHRAPRDLISFSLLCHAPARCRRSLVPFPRRVVSTLTAPESRRVQQRSTRAQDVPPGPRAGRLQGAADQYALY